jgi:hypothetical protein
MVTLIQTYRHRARRFAVAGASILGSAAFVVGCNQPSAPPAATTASPPKPTQALVERGKMLVTIGGCHDCHSPKKYGPKGPEPDADRLLSGHPEGARVDASFKPAPGSSWIAATNEHFTAWSGPWGISFAANLTPDPLTGLRSGVWTEGLFVKALRTGKHMGTARDIQPPMPWKDIGSLSDDDLKAIWAYLGSISPVVNHVPKPLAPNGKPLE